MDHLPSDDVTMYFYQMCDVTNSKNAEIELISIRQVHVFAVTSPQNVAMRILVNWAVIRVPPNLIKVISIKNDCVIVTGIPVEPIREEI